jgi:hypothetical protein
VSNYDDGESFVANDDPIDWRARIQAQEQADGISSLPFVQRPFARLAVLIRVYGTNLKLR